MTDPVTHLNHSSLTWLASQSVAPIHSTKLQADPRPSHQFCVCRLPMLGCHEPTSGWTGKHPHCPFYHNWKLHPSPDTSSQLSLYFIQRTLWYGQPTSINSLPCLTLLQHLIQSFPVLQQDTWNSPTPLYWPNNSPEIVPHTFARLFSHHWPFPLQQACPQPSAVASVMNTTPLTASGSPPGPNADWTLPAIISSIHQNVKVL